VAASRVAGGPLTPGGVAVGSSFLSQPIKVNVRRTSDQAARRNGLFINLLPDLLRSAESTLGLPGVHLSCSGGWGLLHAISIGACGEQTGGRGMNELVDHPGVKGEPAPSRSSPGIVVACIVALLVFVGAVALLYWTWLPRQNPNAMIVVQGNEQFLGAEITAEPMDATSPPVTAAMTDADNYRMRIHVSPGLYRVTIRQNGRVLAMDEGVRAALMEPFFIRLHSPASRPTAKRLQ
jgi:hypothetical protein